MNTWDASLEDALDIVETLDEIAEERDYPHIVRDELKALYQGFIFIGERVKNDH